ncbi:MAG TPA: riboflavin synthase [Gemmatimonadales bacterium]|jgi:riboflavin synthase|nr:riboflavin synthase [Gemmatimonadales bacterium]
MFTGIVTATGTVREAKSGPGGLTLRIEAPFADLVTGESIAVDGACLTVERFGTGWFEVHVIATSLERTLFAEYRTDDKVNLERALAVGDRLGGHLVSGHVDGIGEVLEVRDEADARLVRFTLPPSVADVTIHLGSITVNGVSLTVNALPGEGCEVSLIPHTREVTTLGTLEVGDTVHLEGDMVGKYVRQFTQAWKG